MVVVVVAVAVVPPIGGGGRSADTPDAAAPSFRDGIPPEGKCRRPEWPDP